MEGVMKNNSKAIVSIVVVLVFIIYVIATHINDNSDKQFDDFAEGQLENPSNYTSDVPTEISSSEAWSDFISSRYYSSNMQFNFAVTEDRIVSETYTDDYRVYVEYVFNELSVIVYDATTNDILASFE